MIIRRDFRFEASHILPDHPGQCRNLHGHSYRFLISLDAPVNRETGMTIDFADLETIVEREVLERCDHRHLNEFLPNPTAELIVVWIWERLEGHVPGLVEVELWEVDGCSVAYRGEKEVFG